MHTTGRATYMEADKKDNLVFMRKQGLMTLREFSWVVRPKSNPVVKVKLRKKQKLA